MTDADTDFLAMPSAVVPQIRGRFAEHRKHMLPIENTTTAAEPIHHRDEPQDHDVVVGRVFGRSMRKRQDAVGETQKDQQGGEGPPPPLRRRGAADDHWQGNKESQRPKKTRRKALTQKRRSD